MHFGGRLLLLGVLDAGLETWLTGGLDTHSMFVF